MPIKNKVHVTAFMGALCDVEELGGGAGFRVEVPNDPIFTQSIYVNAGEQLTNYEFTLAHLVATKSLLTRCLQSVEAKLKSVTEVGASVVQREPEGGAQA